MISYSLIFMALSYLVGSIPMAYIAGRWISGIDIRQVGSRNVGAANAYNQLGAYVGTLVVLLDFGKGVGVVLVARLLGLDEGWVLIAGVAAIAGHNWSPFLRFQGGIGAATAFGVTCIVFPLETDILLLAGFLPFLFTRRITVFGAILFGPLPLLVWYFGDSVYRILFSVAVVALLTSTYFYKTRRRSRVLLT
ncbi:MAG: glycerol-3-phosphate acyltransferase [Dehalococcoidia bacterium]